MEQIIDLVIKYGMSVTISIISIWVVLDIYQTLKKKWAPSFLASFAAIAENVKGLNEALHELARQFSDQAPRIEAMHADVKEIKSLLKVA